MSNLVYKLVCGTPVIFIDTEEANWCVIKEDGTLMKSRRTPALSWTRLVQFNDGTGPQVCDVTTVEGRRGLEYLRDCQKTHVFVAHNVAYDAPKLARLQINPERWLDTQVMSQLVDAGRTNEKGAPLSHSLDNVMFRWTGQNPYKEDHQLSDWSQKELTSGQLEYAKEDVGNTYIATFTALLNEIDRLELRHVLDLEMAVQPVLLQMAKDGMKHDMEVWSTEIEHQKDIYASEEFCLLSTLDKWNQEYFVGDYWITPNFLKNGKPAKSQPLCLAPHGYTERGLGHSVLPPPVASGKVVGHIFRKELGLVPGKTLSLNQYKVVRNILNKRLGITGEGFDAKTVTELLGIAQRKKDSTTVEWLTTYQKAAKLNKFLTTYGDSYKARADAKGYIHASFSQTSTDTARIQAKEPNLLNLPRPMQKLLWTAEKDEALIKGDYSSQEGRLVFFLGQQWDMYEKLSNGLDLHSLTASFMSGTPYEDLVTRIDGRDRVKEEHEALRTRAKVATFAPMYGGEATKMAFVLKCSQEEAEKFLKAYWANYPSVAAMQKMQVTTALEPYTRSVSDLSLGRKRFFGDRDRKYPENFHWRNEAMNYAAQSTGASILKRALVDLAKAVKENTSFKITIRLCVHDAIVITAPKKHAQEAADLLKTVMETAAQKVVQVSGKPISIPVDIAFMKNSPQFDLQLGEV